jgi:excisionase family DNA binding protein
MATEDRKVVLKAREAAQYLRVSLFTLHKIERAGLLTPVRTPGGHRRYTLEMLNRYLEDNCKPGNKQSKRSEGRA